MPKSGACHLAFFRSEPSQRDGRSEGDGYIGASIPASAGVSSAHTGVGGDTGGGQCPALTPALVDGAWGLCMQGGETADAKPPGLGAGDSHRGKEGRGLGSQEEPCLQPVGTTASPGRGTSLSTPGRSGPSGQGLVLSHPWSPESSSCLCLSPTHHPTSAVHTPDAHDILERLFLSMGQRSHCGLLARHQSADVSC